MFAMDSDDDLTLPSDTLQILNEFLQEKAQRESAEMKQIENKAGKDAKFEEDWQLSQFWYSDSTKNALGDAVKKIIASSSTNPKDFSISLFSCPSLYKTVKSLHENVKIFEYDKRFAAFGDDFVFYDFNEGFTTDYLKEYASSFDLIIADPPFLSEECIKKISQIILNVQRVGAKIVFCSGEIVESLLKSSLKLNKCRFRPEHERNLGNEFASFANFDLDEFIKS